jgi:hypothetical protein
MDVTMLKEVLEDVLEELKESNRLLKAFGADFTRLEEKVDAFGQKLADKKIGTEEGLANMQLEIGDAVGWIRSELKQGLVQVAAATAAKPTPIVRQWRILLFPETDRGGSYKHFISWVFGGIVLVMLVWALFSLGREWVRRSRPADSVMMERISDSVKPVNKSVTKPIKTKKNVSAGAVRRHERTEVDTLDKSIMGGSPDSARVP